MNADSNPYATPVDTAPGRYEWPLWRRILYACSAIAIVYLLCGAVAAWQEFSHIPYYSDKTTLERIELFFGDWKHRIPNRQSTP